MSLPAAAGLGLLLFTVADSRTLTVSSAGLRLMMVTDINPLDSCPVNTGCRKANSGGATMKEKVREEDERTLITQPLHLPFWQG